MPLTGVKIILASQSPRRSELLRGLVEEFEVIPSEVDEKIDPERPPETNALAMARDKALWVAQRHPGCMVIGADTIVVLDGKIIGKPKDENDARCILKSLCGRRHQVITGVAVANPAGKLFQEAALSCVDFKTATDEEIAAYVRTGEPLDKAGAYAIQGKGAFLVRAHEGSYSNIVGLPVETLQTLLRRAIGKS
ncbi:MAG: Maf family protein [Nitrospinales bacterium]